MKIEIFYGTDQTQIDVTDICIKRLKHLNNIVIIPPNDILRSRYFTDPVPFHLKSIFLKEGSIVKFSDKQTIYINLHSGKFYTAEDVPDQIRQQDLAIRIQDIHAKVHLANGSFENELPEQLMVLRYFTGNEKVLEIGGNIGRNSLVMGYIMAKQKNCNLVVLESDPNSFSTLQLNRDANNMNFYVENSALSKRNLIQMGWNTIVSDTLLPGYKRVQTITYEDLVKKYPIQFDTLVLDCEGAFYYILLDMPEILQTIKLIIMENDYSDIKHKLYIDNVLMKTGFVVDYSEPGGFGPCANTFYEVWKR
jgi:FkbM family methyltransferase